MSHVFISYARADRSRAKRVADALEERGHAVWWDDHIQAGQTFDAAIETALDDAACVIVLWTAVSVKSDWVKTEAAEAARRKILIPALLDEVPVPLEFRRIQTANLTHWEGRADDAEFEKLLRAIHTETGATPVRADVGSPDPPVSEKSASASSRPGSVQPDERSGNENAPALSTVSSPAPGAWRSTKSIALAGLLMVVLLLSAVALWLRAGPSTVTGGGGPKPPDVQLSIQVPNVVGMTYDNAAATLAAIRLVPERQERLSASDNAGTILAQTPAAGVAEAPLSKVVLAVATRPSEPRPNPEANSPAKRQSSPGRRGVDADVQKNSSNEESPDTRTSPHPVQQAPQVEVPKYDLAAEEEQRNRLELLKRRGQVSLDFFDRRRKTIESSGGHLRPEIETAALEYASEVRSATRLIDDHRVGEAKGQVDALEKTVERLDAMR